MELTCVKRIVDFLRTLVPAPFNTISEVYWTDHGRPDVHTNPHQHVFTYDFENKCWMRGDPENF